MTGDLPPQAAAGEEALVGLAEVREAARRLAGVARRTPLLPAELPSGTGVWLKCENFQHGGAFKVRGAYNFIARLSPEEREAGLLTYSSGNHAQGVAYAARAFGARAVIVMPVDAPGVKVEGTRRLGGEVVREGHTTTQRRARAEEIARETGAVIVPPYDHRHIIAGQGTVAWEALEQLREALAAERGGGPHAEGHSGAAAARSGGETAAEGDAGDGGSGVDAAAARSAEEGTGADEEAGRPGLFLVPVGGGGLLSGQAVVLRALAEGCRVVGVEPEGAPSMKRSLEAGEPVSLERVETIADGLKPVRPGDLTFRHARRLVDQVVTVSEEALVEGVRWCFRQKIVAEPSGAATVAALLSGAVEPPERGETVAVVSGGNVDPDAFAGWIGGG